MDVAHADSRPGPVQLCVGECKPELRARSSQLYSFVVRLQLHCVCNCITVILVNHDVASMRLRQNLCINA